MTSVSYKYRFFLFFKILCSYCHISFFNHIIKFVINREYHPLIKPSLWATEKEVTFLSCEGGGGWQRCVEKFNKIMYDQYEKSKIKNSQYLWCVKERLFHPCPFSNSTCLFSTALFFYCSAYIVLVVIWGRTKCITAALGKILSGVPPSYLYLRTENNPLNKRSIAINIVAWSCIVAVKIENMKT